MRLTLPATPWTPGGVRRVAHEAADRARLPAESREALVIAASEAATNVIKHTESPELTVEWRVEGDRLTFLVRDRGVFRWRVHPADDESGWGFPLMSELVDGVRVSPGTHASPGTEIELVVALPERLVAAG